MTHGHFDICSIAKKKIFLWILIEEMDFSSFLHFQLGEKGQSCYVHAWEVDFVKSLENAETFHLFKVGVANASKGFFSLHIFWFIYCLSKDQACHHLNIKLCPVYSEAIKTCRKRESDVWVWDWMKFQKFPISSWKNFLTFRFIASTIFPMNIKRKRARNNVEEERYLTICCTKAGWLVE